MNLDRVEISAFEKFPGVFWDLPVVYFGPDYLDEIPLSGEYSLGGCSLPPRDGGKFPS